MTERNFSTEHFQNEFRRLLRIHQAGDLQNAISSAKHLLGAYPDHPAIFHFLALVHHQKNEHAIAVGWMQKAIAVQPDNAELHSNLSALHLAAGQSLEAVLAADKALQIQPNYPQALINLGNALAHCGETARAAGVFWRATQLSPNLGLAHLNLALAQRSLGQLDGAVHSFERVITLQPEEPQALRNLAEIFAQRNRFADSAGIYQRLAGLFPNDPAVHNNLGAVLQQLGHFSQAEAAYNRAIHCDPRNVDAHRNLGTLLQKQGKISEAIDRYNIALQTGGAEDPQTLSLLGNAHRQLNQLESAEAFLRRALAVQPDDAQSHFRLAFVLLLNRQWSAGWNEYEWRLRLKAQATDPSLANIPTWTGESLTGKILLVLAEQGFGDFLQFARFISTLVSNSSQLIVQCPPELRRLISTISGIQQMIEEPAELVNPPNYQIHIMSLGAALKITEDSIPKTSPYLFADAADCET